MADRSERTSRSWSRTRSPERSEKDKKPKRRSIEVRRSTDERKGRVANGKGSFRRFILTDPVAFKYLEDDPAVAVLETSKELSGFQCYIVEQWATSRTNPTFVITTYTGDATDKITASVLGIPNDEASWSQKLKLYFASLNHYHARRRDHADGIIMVTSLSGFPSTLSILPVPAGNVRQHYADFFVNLNLRRLGCAGRVALTLAPPNSATTAKFYQLYRTSDKLPLYTSVIELVRMCQIALYIFDTLEADYVDGLLCDVTEKAVVRWWGTIGSDFYDKEQHDDLLGPGTVAALMALYLGARRRLDLLGEPVPKDSFDTAGMKKGIARFQRSSKLRKTRRLDKATLLELHSQTRKVASADGWHIPVPHLPQAVKTTVAELSGRGEELLAQGHIRKGKAGVRDIESADMDSLPGLVAGETAKWLWQGKSPKRSSDVRTKDVTFESLLGSNRALGRDHADSNGGKAFAAASGGGESFEADRVRQSTDGRRSIDEPRTRPRTLSHRDTAAKKVQDVLADGKSGFDRLRGASNAHGKAMGSAAADAENNRPEPALKHPPAARSHISPIVSPSSVVSARAPPSSAPRSVRSGSGTPLDYDVPEEPLDSSASQTERASRDLNAALSSNYYEQRLGPDRSSQRPQHLERFLTGLSDLPEPEADASMPDALNNDQALPSELKRTHSASSVLEATDADEPRVHTIRRQLSFSVATGSMCAVMTPAPRLENMPSKTLEQHFVEQKFFVQHLQRLQRAIKKLSTSGASWTSQEIARLERLVQQADEDHNHLREQLDGPTREAQQLKDMAGATLRDQQDMLEDGRRELETLAAKLDYEISSLESKIEDVEVGVDEFERSVELVEGRMEETARDLRGDNRWRCIMQ